MVSKSELTLLRNNLNNKKKVVEAVRNAVDLLNNAVDSWTEDTMEQERNKKKKSNKVKMGSDEFEMFDSLLQLCLNDITPAIVSLCMAENEDFVDVNQHKHLSTTIKKYIQDILKISKNVTEATSKEMMIEKGIIPLLPFYRSQRKLLENLVDHLIMRWSTGHGKLRVITFMGLFKLAIKAEPEFYESILKRMLKEFMRYSISLKKPDMKPLIHFNKISLAETCQINEKIAYKIAFFSVRDMAANVKQFTRDQSKEHAKKLYNWKFINGMSLWTEVLIKTHPSKIFKSLVHGIVQVFLAAADQRNVPTYYPFIFHMCGILTNLAVKTNVYIPVLSYLIPMLESTSKLHRNGSAVNINWETTLTLKKAQLKENISESLVQNICLHIQAACAAEFSSIAFPELVFPVLLKLRHFVKESKNHKEISVVKSLIKKIEENKNFIEKRRSAITFKFNDIEAVKRWEIETRQEYNSPLTNTDEQEDMDISTENIEDESSLESKPKKRKVAVAVNKNKSKKNKNVKKFKKRNKV